MATPTPLKLNYNAASVGMSNSKMIGNTNRTYNDMNQSIFSNYNYNKTNSSDSSLDTSSMDKAIKTQNTIATVGAVAAAGVALASIVSMFKKPATTVGCDLNITPPDETKQVADGLKASIKTANKTGEWSPVKTQLDQATAQLNSVNQDVKIKDGEIADINTNQIPAQEDAIKGLNEANKTRETKMNDDIKGIDGQEDKDTKAVEKQIEEKLAKDPNADVSALRTQIKGIKEAAEKARTIAKNDCKDEQKRNDAKIKEADVAISDLKKSITAKEGEIKQLKSAVPKLKNQISEATEALSNRTVEPETTKKAEITKDESVKTVKGTEAKAEIPKEESVKTVNGTDAKEVTLDDSKTSGNWALEDNGTTFGLTNKKQYNTVD